MVNTATAAAAYLACSNVWLAAGWISGHRACYVFGAIFAALCGAALYDIARGRS